MPSMVSRMARTISGRPMIGGGERGARPAEGEDDAAALVEKGADRAFAAEGEEQEIAGDDRAA